MSDHLKKIFSARNIFIAVLTLACLLALWWTFLDARALYRSNERLQLKSALARRPAQTSDIQPWMTFDYLNVIFKLPPAYLKTELAITDPHYPNIQISRYARHQALDQATFVQSIQNAIARYGSPK